MEVWKLFQSIILGAVQGLTEFLPVSSSGHLTLLARLFGISGGLFFDLVLHLGTLGAVCISLRREIVSLGKQPKKLFCLVLASVPAAIAGLLFSDQIDGLFSGMGGPYLLSLCFLATAALLLAAELAGKKRRRSFGLKQALSMGAAQAFALLPGLSRSGTTIAAGIFAGGEAEETSRFSFLMSIPVILGGTLVEGIRAATSNAAPMSEAWWVLAVGVLASFVFGLLSLRLMRAVSKRADYKWFALYLILLAATTVWLAAIGLF